MDQRLIRLLEDTDARELGERIRVARVAAGLTQPELGSSAATAAHVSRVERGERRPTPRLLEHFAAVLRTSVENLVQGTEGDESRRLQLALDFAELELNGGDPAAALKAIEQVERDAGLLVGGRVADRLVLLRATAKDALGRDDAHTEFELLLASTTDVKTRLQAATALSRLRRERGDLAAAIAVARDALEPLADFAAAGADEVVRLQVTLAAALFEAGDERGAQDICVDALSAAESLDSLPARAAAYWNMSIIQAESGAVEMALSLARKSLALFESQEGIRDLARLRTQLGTILLRADPPQVEEAFSHLDLADRELSWSATNPADRARNDLVIARAHYIRGEIVDAVQFAQRALDAAAELPLVRMAGLTLLGQVATGEHRMDDARAHYLEAIRVLTGIGADRAAGQMWFDLGALLDEAGLVDEARDAYRRAASSIGMDVRTQGLRVSRTSDARG